jgi:Flp pilus assembly protein TadD
MLLACANSNSVVRSDKPSSRYSADFNAAVATMQSGDVASAKAAFEALTEKAPNYSGPWTNLGIISAEQRDYVQAETYFNKALRRQSKNTIAMNWLGYLSAARKDYSSAEKWYLRAIAIDPQYAEAHLNIAMLYEANMRRPKDALEHYRIYQSHTKGASTLVAAWIRNLEENSNYVASNAELSK